MKSQAMQVSKLIVAVFLAVACALAFTPMPHELAYAESGALAAGQGVQAAAVEAAAPAGGTVLTDMPVAAGEAAAESDDAAEPAIEYADVDIAVRGRIQGAGWGDWSESGVAVGTKKGPGVNALKLKLTNLDGLSGSVVYRTYKRGVGWREQVSNGKSTGSMRFVEALKVKLVGEVALHYDVLYRTYEPGRGWHAWAKNGASSGVVMKKSRVSAVQVKLSPKTEEAAGNTTEKIGIRYEARLSDAGWQVWKGNGKAAGKAGKMLGGLAVKADAGTLSGGVQYRAYNVRSHWTDWKSDGAFAGSKVNRLDAIEIKLTGDIAQTYNVWYRAYVQGTGWLDWAKNGAKSGSTGLGLRLEAFQVKLVKKGAPAPGDTQYATVNKMDKTMTLNGIDIASWQAGINPAAVSADFIIVKATGGTGYTNPYFKQWSDATLASGKMLGLYHFARESSSPGSAAAEARHFVKAAGPYVGRAMLFLDFEADALNMPDCVAWAKKFMDTVHVLTGVKPLIYTSKNVTRQFDWSSVASKYGLWVAQYPNYEPVHGYLDAPWTDAYGYGAWSAPTLFQYTSQGYIEGYGSNLDLNKFYGSVLSWRRLQRAS